MGVNDRYATEIRNCTYGKEMREPIASACENRKYYASDLVDEVEQLHNERVNSVSVTPITEITDHYMLVLTRANHQ